MIMKMSLSSIFASENDLSRCRSLSEDVPVKLAKIMRYGWEPHVKVTKMPSILLKLKYFKPVTFCCIARYIGSQVIVWSFITAVKRQIPFCPDSNAAQ